jgi:hypothetical protein
MLIRRDVSEPWPPTGLLFIPWVNASMESHGGDDASWGKLLTCPPELSGNPTSRDIWKRVGGMDGRVRISHNSIFDMSMDLMTWDLQLYFPSEGRCAADFYRLKNPSPRLGLNLRPLGPVASTLIATPPRRLGEKHVNLQSGNSPITNDIKTAIQCMQKMPVYKY